MFSLAFAKKIIFDHKRSFVGYSIGLSLYGLLMTLFYSSMKDSFDDFAELLEAYPPALKEAFGINASSFSTLEGYLSVEYFSFVWIVILSIFVFMVGTSIMAGEVDRGSSDYAYSLPAKRRTIVLSKFTGGLVMCLALSFLSLLATIIGAYIIGEKPHLAGFAALLGTVSFVILFLLGLTTLFSVLFDSKAKVFAGAAIFFVASYILHILAGLNDSLENFYPWSFFKYYGNPEVILREGSMSQEGILVLGSVGLGFLIAALLISEDRDL